MSFLGDALEGGRHVRIHAVVAADAGDAVFSCTLVRRSAGDEHPRAVVSQRARDAAADAVRGPGNDGDTVVEG